MTARTDFDRLVASWLESAGPADVRATIVDAALAEAARTRRAKGFLGWLAGRSPWPPLPGPRLADRVPSALRLAIVVAVMTALVGASLFAASRLVLPAPSEGPPMVVPTALPTASTPTPPSPLRSDTPPVAGWEGTIVIPVLAGPDRAVFRLYQSDGQPTTLDVLGHGRSCPTLSRDGRVLAWLSRPNGAPADRRDLLMLVDRDGTNPRSIWSGRLSDQVFHQILWSPDDQQLLASGAIVPDSTEPGGHVVLGRRDGGPATLLPTGGGESSGTLAWSPDGRELATIVAIDERTNGIAIRDLATGTERTVTTALTITSLAWSPDGASIAYTASTTFDVPFDNDLYRVGLDGSEPVLVAPDSPGGESLLAWSPDGRWLAVVERTLDSDAAVVIFDRDLQASQRLGPVRDTTNMFLTWSPDSRSVLLSLGGGGEGDGPVPTILFLDGAPARRLDVPSDQFYAQCALSWAPAPG